VADSRPAGIFLYYTKAPVSTVVLHHLFKKVSTFLSNQLSVKCGRPASSFLKSLYISFKSTQRKMLKNGAGDEF
jgi:hypothetical protein